MFKKAFQIVVTFSLLVGGHAGYVRLFAIVEGQLGQAVDGDLIPFPETESKSALRATELARETLGAGSFAAQRNLKIRYYDSARGYYMYAENYERLKDGKRLKIWPFALVWVSKDGRSRKTATSDEAVIDLTQPFDRLVKTNNEPSHITHAVLSGDVRLRDDKGTRDDPTDDLRVGPMTQLEYDEKTLQITSESDVFLQDRDLTLTGLGLKIQLRRKVPVPGQPPSPGGSGFDAESAHLYKDIHVVVKNVGSSGILPGTAKPEQGGQTPLDLRADGRMDIDLPRPRPVVLIGPPDLDRPPDPTRVRFETNVRVLRGSVTPDQLNSDTLDLTLMPGPKTAEAPAVTVTAVNGESATTAAPASGGPLTDLKLRTAFARGHAVWLQSEVQGMKARCVELKYEKAPEPGIPDKTNLNGGTSKIWVEKVEFDVKGPNPSAIKSILTLYAIQATIFDSGPGGTSEVIALGPGKTEDRPSREASVLHTAYWEDEMRMLTWRDGQAMPKAGASASDAPGPAGRGSLRRLITLTGVSKLIEHKDPTTLDARKSIVAEFEAAPVATPTGTFTDGETRIKWLQGFEDVHLTAPGRTLTARKQLDAKFVEPVVARIAPQPAPPTGPTSTFLAPSPVVAANPPAPPPSSAPEPPPTAPVQAVDARADRVWATVLLGSGVRPNGELKDAQLRGGVMVHQEPAPGKAVGNDATGEALDLVGQGNGLMKFVVASEVPQALNPRAKLASGANPRPATTPVLARVDFEGRTIEAPLIGLDQMADYAWAQGAGNFLQMADAGLLDDKGLAADGPRVAARPVNGSDPAKDRLVITWTEEMKFFGRSTDLQGRTVAKAEFRGVSREVRTPDGTREFRRGVETRMVDSAIFSETLDVYMDKVIALNKEVGQPKPARKPGEAAEPDAQIASMDCRGKNLVEAGKLQYAGVDITSQKLYPGTKIVKEKQRIQSTHVLYDKQTGDFECPGPGTTYLYKRKNPSTAAAGQPAIIPVAGSGTRGRPDSGLDPRKYGALELTKVVYTEGMRGRFGTSKLQAETETRHAEFVGSVEAANSTVDKSNSDIDFDRPRASDYLFLTSDVLHVYSQPPPVDSKLAPRQLMNARGNAAARTLDRTIQGDRMTYDSATDLLYAFGDNSKEVVMIEQKSQGQEPTTTRGTAARYNKTTRSGVIIDPQAIQLYDLGTGTRPQPFYPDLGGSPKPVPPIKPQRMPFMKTPRNSTERKGFTGGT